MHDQPNKAAAVRHQVKFDYAEQTSVFEQTRSQHRIFAVCSRELYLGCGSQVDGAVTDRLVLAEALVRLGHHLLVITKVQEAGEKWESTLRSQQ